MLETRLWSNVLDTDLQRGWCPKRVVPIVMVVSLLVPKTNPRERTCSLKRMVPKTSRVNYLWCPKLAVSQMRAERPDVGGARHRWCPRCQKAVMPDGARNKWCPKPVALAEGDAITTGRTEQPGNCAAGFARTRRAFTQAAALLLGWCAQDGEVSDMGALNECAGH